MRGYGWVMPVWLLGEVAAFSLAGRAIGVLAVLALVVAGAAAGLALWRATARDIGDALAALRSGRLMAAPDGMRIALRLAAAALLALPGFLSDVAAVVLLVPAVQRLVGRRLARRSGGAVVIEGVAVELRPDDPRH
jgi:UPF0716 protein FxsA